MRYISLPITKAAHKRLSLLAKNNQLPVPLTEDETTPFGFRHTNTFLVLTHEGRDVAYVTNQFENGGKDVKIYTPMAENESFDLAVKRTMKTINEYTKTANRLVEQQSVQDKMTRAEETRRRAVQERTLPESLMPLTGEDIDGRLEGLDAQKMQFLCYSNIPDTEGLTLMYHTGNSFKVYAKGKEASALLMVTDGVLTLDQNNAGFSAKKLGDKLSQMYDWAVKINDPETISQAILDLPEPDTSIVSYVVTSPKDNYKVTISLANDIEIIAHNNHVRIKKDEVDVLLFSLIDLHQFRYIASPINMPSSAKLCFSPVGHNTVHKQNRSLFTEEHYARMGAAIIRARAEADPDFDATKYALPDNERVTRDVEATDFGYGF